MSCSHLVERHQKIGKTSSQQVFWHRGFSFLRSFLHFFLHFFLDFVFLLHVFLLILHFSSYDSRQADNRDEEHRDFSCLVVAGGDGRVFGGARG